MALKGAGKRIVVSGVDRLELERIVRAVSSEVRMVERARIVLCAAEGMTGDEIASRVGCSLPTVVKWRGRYARDGMDGLRDAPRTGRPLTHGPEKRALLIAKACTRPPDTDSGQRRERWTHRELGEQVGISESPDARDPEPGGDSPAPDRVLGDDRFRPTRVRGPGGRGVRPVPRSARWRAGALDRREDQHPGPRARASGHAAEGGQARASRLRVHAQRGDEPVRGVARALRRDARDDLHDP